MKNLPVTARPNDLPSGSNGSFKHPVSESERRKAKAIASALSGGSKARQARIESEIVRVLAVFNGTIERVDFDPAPLSAQ